MRPILLFLSFFSLWAVAAPRAVSVTSRVCGATAALRSSGLPVIFRGKSYVLTSSWGVLEEAEGVCHEVVDSATGQSYAAKLAALDWSAGFALLAAPELPAELDLDSVTSVVPSAGELEIVGGAEVKRGRIVASKSTRHHLPGLAHSYEVITDKITSAFVGAPVFGEAADGIVSSQWIKIVAGSRAQVREWKSNASESANHIVVIPLGLIRQRLASKFPAKVTFQPWPSKLSDRALIYAGGYAFRLQCPEGAGEPPSDGIGPIGGADGVGIGGPMKGAITCEAKITAQTASALENPVFLPKALFSDVEKALQSTDELTIPFLSVRNAGGYLARVPFFSVPHLFTEISRAAQWGLLLKNASPGTGATPYERLMLQNAKVKKLLLDSYPLIASREDERDDYRFLYTHCVLLESFNWKILKWKDYSAMATKPAPGDFAKGVTWEGQPLRLVLKENLEKLDKLYQETGGNQ